MPESNDQFKVDQKMAEVIDMMVGNWSRMYKGLIREDFTEDQAMSLVRAHIYSLHSGKSEE